MQYPNSTRWTNYYFEKNVQGDVIGVYQKEGDGNSATHILAARYSYDPYGNPTSMTNGAGTAVSQTSNTIAAINPFRYRGYRYDGDTGLYYLRSRYYDPVSCRFVNADTYASTGQGVVGHNMYAYCGCNPVVRTDNGGDCFFTALGAAIGFCAGLIDGMITGEDPLKNAQAGAISGAIAGAGVDVGLMVAASGPVGWGVAAAAVGGIASGVVSTGMSTDWNADPLEYLAAGVTGGLLNIVSFGLGPVGSVPKGTITDMVNYITLDGMGSWMENLVTGTIMAEGGIWITRVVTNNNSLSTPPVASASQSNQRNSRSSGQSNSSGSRVGRKGRVDAPW